MLMLNFEVSIDHGGETWKWPKAEAWASESLSPIAGNESHMRTYNVRVGWLKTAIGLHIGVTRVSNQGETHK
jgi:hypothetical protein